MASKWKAGILTATLVLSTMPNVKAAPKHGGWDNDRFIRHVLLISIDGMHAVDYKNCVASGTCPTLAELGETGVNYTRTKQLPGRPILSPD
jgi:hypothetical protein